VSIKDKKKKKVGRRKIKEEKKNHGKKRPAFILIKNLQIKHKKKKRKQ